MSDRRVLIFGIDGGTWTVLKPAMEQGYMPFLKSLVDKGASGILESTIPAITPAAWGAFQTGKNPGKTGVFDFAFWDIKQHKSQYVNSLDLGSTLWDISSHYGKRVAAINVPMTYPPKPVNGYLVSGLLTPSLESEFTWPRELKEELLKTVPEYHIFDLKKMANCRSEEEKFENFIGQMFSSIENRTRAALWILQKEPLDLLMVHFQATDVLQHVYWHHLDKTHPLFQATKQSVIFDKFYRVLDQEIERIHDAFAKKNGMPLTIILSDHGFQQHFKRFNLGNWLNMHGYLKINPTTATVGVPLLKKVTRKLRIGKLLSCVLPSTIIQSVDQKYISRNELFDWNQSTAFSVGRSGEGFIYCLPLKNDLTNSFAEELRQKLLHIEDPETGRSVVKKVWLKSDIYKGEKAEYLPDLTIEPQEGYSFTGYYQPGQRLLHTVNTEEDMHMGKHHRDGILIASGIGVKTNRNLRARIVDLAPTLLACIGIPVPEEMDGKVLSEWFDLSPLNPFIPPTEKSPDKDLAQNHRFSKKESDEIENRLKDLGYL